MSQNTNADDTGRIADSQRVAPAARIAACSIVKNATREVHAIEPCGTVSTAAELVVPTPCAGLSRALNKTGYEVRGVLSSRRSDPENTVRIWIDEE